ncbi:cytidylyltransferase domain-containing protein [Methanobrevibacter filiformis]|uniref:CMP-N,N'-diacetyllegionaminic acid synthase n=1 Tax=Methanobrevibacter filiformis TaxID=55758 RepID=A0A166AWZ3_9EURY|nr:glycosyltransferase [Methanobrevibacter filiformis]KZX12574.1 CMP-N,N'-diacetyllegionaminic acid synthase [Methanobrevibacter filiformis]
MYENKKVIVIIPARGGSKGIPRKNIRLLVNKPLIAYSIETAKNSKYVDDVIVSTDDEEIKFISEQFEAKTIIRKNELASDDIPLDPVIYDAVKKQEKIADFQYDYIITIQPTSPLLKTYTLDKAIEKLAITENDTVISVVDDRHLSWGYDSNLNNFYPLYKKRLNRQYLPKTYKETGGIFATKKEFLKENSRLGNKIDLIEIPIQESIDIDNYEDWWVAERILKKKRILIKTDASYEIGTGHIHRGLAICSRLTNHDVVFLLDENKQLGLDIVENYNYPYLTHKNYDHENKKDNKYDKNDEEDNKYNDNNHNKKYNKNSDLLNKIKEFKPDIVINDVLNTSKEYISTLKENNYFVINFEDIGEGAEKADIVFDALYEHQIPLKNTYSGYRYYILKNEFYYQNPKEIKENVEEILITFGGTDPNNLTKKTLTNLLESNYNKHITVILGLGYHNTEDLEKEFSNLKNIEIYKNVKNISEYMAKADIIFTSAGRTMYEVASLGVPCVCLCQNKREISHVFGNTENGFINLGLGKNVSNDELLNTIEELINNYKLRKEMNNKMLNIDLKHGFENIMKIIKDIYKNR